MFNLLTSDPAVFTVLIKFTLGRENAPIRDTSVGSVSSLADFRVSADVCLRGLELVDPALESVPLLSFFNSKKASVAPLLIIGFVHLRFLKKNDKWTVTNSELINMSKDFFISLQNI